MCMAEKTERPASRGDGLRDIHLSHHIHVLVNGRPVADLHVIAGDRRTRRQLPQIVQGLFGERLERLEVAVNVAQDEIPHRYSSCSMSWSTSSSVWARDASTRNCACW